MSVMGLFRPFGGVQARMSPKGGRPLFECAAESRARMNSILHQAGECDLTVSYVMVDVFGPQTISGPM
jgi:hypothetical protein